MKKRGKGLLMYAKKYAREARDTRETRVTRGARHGKEH